ncbi:hypothetical protein SAMN04515647_2753 [Cohaesibacter sp. ES.047]|nr:hypothetical protein SAMN04515647_2753 [Cohaesibacter sp. ES.047]
MTLMNDKSHPLAKSRPAYLVFIYEWKGSLEIASAMVNTKEAQNQPRFSHRKSSPHTNSGDGWPEVFWPVFLLAGLL